MNLKAWEVVGKFCRENMQEKPSKMVSLVLFKYAEIYDTEELIDIVRYEHLTYLTDRDTYEINQTK
ncbi:MAG: hypothetical protein HRU18_03005 [Pseudoalteromonas sp.]|uniref:hypothetical protein n=1 Tax=Pseudoalteromonas sp. TaxID=53249 RepID=UPI001D868356|nr:hypothetical protein [Pseudoalteromonas sp.]NRA77154.1 hypothetical protein [Pseudoalteromonas sp.]